MKPGGGGIPFSGRPPIKGIPQSPPLAVPAPFGKGAFPRPMASPVFSPLPADFPQNFLEPVRQGAFQLHRFPGGGVEEPQPPGVEALSRQTGDGLFRPIHRIPQQGVADGGKVDPYLVGAARLQAALHMGIPGIDRKSVV